MIFVSGQHSPGASTTLGCARISSYHPGQYPNSSCSMLQAAGNTISASAAVGVMKSSEITRKSSFIRARYVSFELGQLTRGFERMHIAALIGYGSSSRIALVRTCGGMKADRCANLNLFPRIFSVFLGYLFSRKKLPGRV